VAAGQHADGLKAVNPGVIPPGIDHGRHGVETLSSDVEAAGFAVVVHRLVDVSGSEQSQGSLVELMSLTLIDRGQIGDDSVPVGNDPMEHPA
jgi:hypothetical protein